MLEKQLLAARSEQAARRGRIVDYSIYASLIVAIALALTAAIFFVVELVTPVTPELKLPQEQAADSAAQPPADAARTAPPQSDDSPQGVQPTENTPTVAGNPPLREQFMQQLAQYEKDIEPKIEHLHLDSWDQQRRAELANLKEQAVAAFLEGEYSTALATLQNTRAAIDKATLEHTQRLNAAKQATKAAFDANRVAEAQQQIQHALALSPTDAEMLALQKRLEVLPQVLALLKQAEVAQLENRPAKELALLQKVLALDPQRELIKSQAADLQEQLQQQQFSAALSNAQRALDAGDLAVAKKALEEAKAVFPENAALVPLQNRLQQLQIERGFAKHLSLGNQAKQADAWPTAKKHFQQAQQLRPNSKTALENYQLAEQIVAATEKITTLLDQAPRLADNDIANSATAYLQEVNAIVDHSPTLKRRYAELTDKIAAYRIEVDVVVVSDNKTDIIVKGTGQVGKTRRRTIRLRPGEYVFEGSRAGYKSKLVRVAIQPGVPPEEVVIQCDEKI